MGGAEIGLRGVLVEGKNVNGRREICNLGFGGYPSRLDDEKLLDLAGAREMITCSEPKPS